MLRIVFSTKFKKDFKRIQKQGKDLNRLQYVIDTLQAQNALEPRFYNHKLQGNYGEYYECHIQPDWLLIYKFDEHHNELFLNRMGSHSDLF